MNYLDIKRPSHSPNPSHPFTEDGKRYVCIPNDGGDLFKEGGDA